MTNLQFRLWMVFLFLVCMSFEDYALSFIILVFWAAIEFIMNPRGFISLVERLTDLSNEGKGD